MVSELEKIWRSQPRIPESRPEMIDTREEIRHRDPDQERKKHHQRHKNENASLFEDDQTVVSLDVLENFLNKLLHIHQDTASPQSCADYEQADQNTNPPAYAASMYARTASWSEENSSLSTFPPIEAEKMNAGKYNEEHPDPKLNQEEIDIIHRIQQQIPELRNRNKTQLSLRMKGPFLYSVEAAILRLL